jgi:hypothetical protein
MGSRDGMLRYLSAMTAELQAWQRDRGPECTKSLRPGSDQDVHNFLFYSGRLPNALAIPHRTGPVHTVGYEASILFNSHGRTNWTAQNKWPPAAVQTAGLVDGRGRLVNLDGMPSAVVHQHDRFGTFRSAIESISVATTGGGQRE